MIDSAQLRTEATVVAPPLDPTREAQAARAVLPHVRADMAILDLRCGAGWSSLLLAARTGAANKPVPLIACDPDANARAATAQHIAQASFQDRVQVVQQPPANLAFDLVYVSHRASHDLHEALATATSCLKQGGVIAVALPAEAITSAIPMMQLEGLVITHATSGEPILLANELPASAEDLVVLAHRVSDRVGLSVRTHLNQAALLQIFGMHNPGVLLEDDLDTIDNECEHHGRKRRDAEVLCGLAASHPGPCLDLGTSHGRSAFKLATNIGHNIVTTVNMLPEQAVEAGVHITHILQREEIGSYPRDHGVRNIRQLYANTLDWNWYRVPDDLNLAFVDACHDAEAVYADSRQAWRRLGTGGFLVWHDFSPSLAKVHPWIESSMAGVSQFYNEVRPTGEIQHLLGSWCGVLRKEASDA
ncbi:MAG: putative O-methyltransferase YrrM [Planctomycetota bacterium]|jgi:predicted O-methyltransferase YrrM